MPQVQVRLTEKPEEEIWGREQSVGVEGRKKKKALDTFKAQTSSHFLP